MRRRLLPIVVAVSALAGAAAAPATVYNLTPSGNWYSVLTSSSLKPGDEVVLGAGTYSTSSWLPIVAQGTAAAPIVIRAAQGARVIITKTTSGQNNMDIRGAQYLTIRGLEFTGASHAIRISEGATGQDARNITIENSYFHDIGGPAISCNHSNQTYVGMVFRNNEITRTGGHGEGFYLGNNDGTALFRDSIVERNFIHDLVPVGGEYQGDGIDLKIGAYNNTIRNNVIYNTNYPGITVGGTNGRAPNIIEGNVIWGTGDHGIQLDSDAIVRNNIVVGGGADGIRVQNDQAETPGNLTIVHNTVLSTSSGKSALRINAATLPYSSPIRVANNALYGSGGGSAVRATVDGVKIIFSGNVGAGAVLNAGGGSVTLPLSQFDRYGNLLADFVNAANMDFFPRPGSALIGEGDPAYAVLKDFIGMARAGTVDVGAYLYLAGGNPGWGVSLGFKKSIFGDADLNGYVDLPDLVTLARHWNAGSAVWEDGEFSGDGVVGLEDLIVLARSWRLGAPPVAGQAGMVPEPAALALVLAGGGLLFSRSRRGR